MGLSDFSVPSFESRLAEALALHRGGRVAEAAHAYEKLRAERPGSGDVIGLLAMVAFQSGETEAAKRLWREALAAEAEAPVKLRDLNNLLATLREEGATAEAEALADGPLPAWPSGQTPDARARDTLISLAAQLLDMKRPAAGLALLSGAVPFLAGDPAALELLGLLHLEAGQAEDAFAALSRAREATTGAVPMALRIALAASAHAADRLQEAHALYGEAVRAGATYMAPAADGQLATVLMLNELPPLSGTPEPFWRLHFHANYPSQLHGRFARDFRFTSRLAELEEGRTAADGLPPPQVILNNITNGELLSAGGLAERLAAFVDGFSVPVINHPLRAVQTTRQRMAHLLADLDDVVIPAMRRFGNDKARRAELMDLIEGAFPYPFLVRDTLQQGGLDMWRIDDRAGLETALDTLKTPEFYVASFAGNRNAEGLYRKIRAAVVGDEIITLIVDYDTDWCVHGRVKPHRHDFYRARPDLLEEEARICADPEGRLGARAMAALRAIRSRTPLEIFGIDFDVLPDGRVLFFEANATMILLVDDLGGSVPDDIAYLSAPAARTAEAIRALLLEKAGRG